MHTCAQCGQEARPRLSGYEDAMKRLDVPSNSRVDAACRALEDLGYRFLIHYGLDNAEAMLRMETAE